MNEPMDISATVESKALDDSYRNTFIVEATYRRGQSACADHLLTVNISELTFSLRRCGSQPAL